MNASDVILRARGLTKRFGAVLAVTDVDIDIRRHSVHALIGPNGAGKTTVFNLLSKFLQPSAGRIEFQGQDITRVGPADVARMGLVRSFQISSVFPHLTVLENVVVPLQRKAGLATQFWKSKQSLTALEVRAHELLANVNLSSYASTTAVELSYGRKRALEIATTLALDPPVLLLDEPMAGIGTEEIDHMAGVVRTASRNRTIVIVEHNLSVVADLCDQVTVLARGQILAEGDYAKVSTNPAVRDAYMGTSDDE
jgi:branched-chain amino acid transport system ATP-binding protein